MASDVAPPKNTGGGGFVFEDDVCAWLLASMLVGEAVLGVDCGAPVRLDFQTRPDGWLLDDVLVTTAVTETRHRFALSIKSNAQFTATAAPSDFVAAAWEQLLHIGSTTFDATVDFMGLVTAPLSGAAAHSLSGLAEKARANDPSLFPSRLATPNWASADERDLFASFACPASLGQTTTDVDAARLLQRLRFIQRDFGAVASESQNRALELCRRAVRSHTIADAQTLWSILRQIASELRPRAGSLTMFDLVDRLRARVALADYPDHGGDWATLDARSTREAGLVRSSVADRIRLPRDEQVAAVIQSIAGDVQVALLGASGVGKSALAKAAFEQRTASGKRTLWVDASSLDRVADYGAFEASLQLRHSLAELLGGETSPEPVVIIDGLDRLYADHSFRTVAAVLRAVGGGPRATRWRVLSVCQSQEWPRVLEGLQRAGAPLTRWRVLEAAALRPADLHPVREAFPSLARLLRQPQVGSLLTNLKLLDLVVRRLDGGTEIDASAWVGESSVAEWFWSAEIERGADRLARGQFMRGLAQAQAEQLTASVSIDTLDASWLNAAQSLTADQLLVQVPGDRLAFAHDLYGDWARLRLLLNHRADLKAFLQERHESPLWHRALRLLGIHLLERENGVAEWRTLMSSFHRGNLTIVRDLLLEAPAFAMNAGRLLESIFPDLVAADGVLLQRLLTRFLAFATVPDEQMQAIARGVGVDAHEARAAFRRPHRPYWFDVLAVLHRHRREVVNAAPCETARIVEMWLEFVPPGSVRRSEAADLAVMLGQRAVNTRHDWRGRDEHGDRQRFYKCALLAAPERPNEVAHIAKTAAERVPRPAQAGEEPTPQPRPRSILGPGVMRGPWPDGPLARVDNDFQYVILEGTSIENLYRVRPAEAREVILATLIEAPHEVHWGSRIGERELGLAHRIWRPTKFPQGPFLGCLRVNFVEGLELIMRLVEFATERSNEDETRKQNNWRASAVADGRSEAEIEEAMKTAPPQRLVLHDGTKELYFTGDAGSYGWSAGVTSAEGYSPLPPSAVELALMALEQYFYQRLDAAQDISAEVAATLARSRCVAPLGVLVDVGKRHMVLWSGPLRVLLSAPELYAWDIRKTVQGRSHHRIRAFQQTQDFTNRAEEFHSLEHRRRYLSQVAMEQLLNRKEMQTFFSVVRDWWKKRQAAGEQLNDMASQIDLCLDPTNYETRDNPTHGKVIVNVAIERVQAERATEQQEADDRMLAISFPIRCRTILDERQSQTNAQLDELWQAWSRIRAAAKTGTALPGGEECSGNRCLNAIMAGITVFLWHDEWLEQDVARRPELQDALESILSDELDEHDGFYSEHDVSTLTWDCFLAESVAMLWARAPQDVRWRRLVAHMVFADKYATVRLLFSRCAEHRSLLGDDFGRLRRLVLDWAHVREHDVTLRNLQHMRSLVDDQMQERVEGEVASWVEQAISSFVDGSLPGPVIDWSRFDEAARLAEFDALRRRWSDYRLMDVHLMRCSHEWIPEPDDAQSPTERASVIQFWWVALDVVSARPRADLRRGDDQYPDDDELWVLGNVAAAVLQLRPNEKPERFWTAIIDLHSEAHDWPEKFLTALHRRALAAEKMPTTYAALLREIVQRALSDVNGERRWPWHEEVWDALIGIDYWVSDLWSERHADHVLGIWDVISLWMKNAPQERRRLGKFARWLSNAAAAPIRLRVLPWFVAQLQPREGRSVYGDNDVEDDLGRLLNVVWDQDQLPLRASSESFAAFRGLLVWLVECQNSLGLELQGRMGGLV